MTINDVADAAGVSTATVSRVINNSDTVTEKTASIVKQTINEIGYIPQTAARNLASSKTHTIGVILREIGKHFAAQILRGIETCTFNSEFDLLIASYHTDEFGNRLNLPLGDHNTDGLIILPGCLSDEEIKRLHQVGLPMVLLYQLPPENLAIPSIHIENKSGTQQLIDHLIEVHGCQRFAYLTGPKNNLDSIQRYQGMCQSLKTHGLMLDTDLVGFGDYSEEQAQETVQNWINKGKKIDAIFGGSDEGAIGAIMALKEKGVSVPNEIAVVGFDDMNHVRYVSPPLTTVHAPTEQIGMLAVETLIHMINDEPVKQVNLLPTELVIRQSCGCHDRKL